MYYFILGMISALVTVPISQKIKKSAVVALLASFILPMLSIAIYLLLLKDFNKKNKSK